MRLYTDAEVRKIYGDPRPFIDDDGRVAKAWELQILTSFPAPRPLPLAWGGTVKRISCHRLVADSLAKVLNELSTLNAWDSIDDWGGCYCWRPMRNAKKLSRHSWGIAVDLDTKDNHFGTAGSMHPKIIEVFRKHGWYWGGDFNGVRRDPMHFEKAVV